MMPPANRRVRLEPFIQPPHALMAEDRAYLYRSGQLDQITQDHTVTAEMVRRGALRPDEAAGHRLRHAITNVVGGHELGVTAEAHALDVQPGDRLLLCSDGLTEMVSNDAIAAALHAEPSSERAATMLISQALEAGGRDNVTVLIVRFDLAEAIGAVRDPDQLRRTPGPPTRPRLNTTWSCLKAHFSSSHAACRRRARA